MPVFGIGAGFSAGQRKRPTTSTSATAFNAGRQPAPTSTQQMTNTGTRNTNTNTRNTTATQELQNILKNTSLTSQRTSTQREQGTIVTDNMDPATRAAFNRTLATLEGGGTAAQRAGNAGLMSAQLNAQNLASSYSPAAARAQAQQSMASYAAKLNEQILPQINAAMEAAGLSGDSMNALLSQDAATRIAREAADAELAAIVGYGQLQQGQQRIGLDASTGLQNDPVMNQLLSALNVGKGSMQTETRDLTTSLLENQTQRGTESTSGTTTTNATEIGTTNVGETSNNTADVSGWNALDATRAAQITADTNAGSDNLDNWARITSLLRANGQSPLDALNASRGTQGTVLNAGPASANDLMRFMGLR